MSAPQKKAVKKPAAHPPCSEMIAAALGALKERGGSSAQKIRAYIAANYKVDMAKLKTFINRALKSGVAKGTLVQTSGKGASGKFKLAEKPKAAKKPAKKAAKKPKKKAAKKAAKKPAAKKATKKPAKKAAKKPAKKAAKKAKKPAKKAAPKKK